MDCWDLKDGNGYVFVYKYKGVVKLFCDLIVL